MGLDRKLSILFEEVSLGYKIITNEETNNLIKKSASKYRTQQKVYTFIPKEDVEDADYIEVNTPEKESTYKNKYYEIIMDSLKRWSDFPKRGKSVVSYTNKEKDKENDTEINTYIVIPYNDTNIGICTKGDILNSFSYVAINLGLKFEFFNEALNLLLNIFNNPTGTYDETTKKLIKEELNSYDTNYDTFRNALNKVDNYFFTEEGKNILDEILNNPYNKETEDSVISLIQYMKAKDLKLLNIIDKLFDPIENGFKHMLFSEFILSENKNKEIWLADPCLLVKESVFDTINFGDTDEDLIPDNNENEENINNLPPDDNTENDDDENNNDNTENNDDENNI